MMRTHSVSTLSLHDALPICAQVVRGFWQQTRSAVERTGRFLSASRRAVTSSLVGMTSLGYLMGRMCGSRLLALMMVARRSEEHTSELQSPCILVCCFILEHK